MNTMRFTVSILAVACFAASVANASGVLQPGAVFKGQVIGEKSSRTWMLELHLTSVSPSGEISGEASWPSLDSVNAITGKWEGRIFTFREVGYIKRGGAVLNAEYALVIEKDMLLGRWVQGDSDAGTLCLTPSTQEAAAKPAFIPGMKFSGTVSSERSHRDYESSVEIQAIDANGNFHGTIAWPSLAAVHKIVGRIEDKSISFTETEYIKRGGAHLNCSYHLGLDGSALTGSWIEPDFDKGRVTMNLENAAEGR